MDLIKIQPDKERAKSLLKLAMLRHRKIAQFDAEKESSLIAESYYEIAKELITALLFLEGYKTLSHKDLIEHASKRKDFTEHEINVLDTLRVRRNKIVYYGIFVDASYIERNRKDFERIIEKLRQIVESYLE